MNWGLILLAALLNNSALVLIRLASVGIHWAQGVLSISLYSGLYLAGGLLAYGTSFLLTVRILSIFSFAVAIPLFIGFQFILTAAMTHFVFHETLTWVTWVGVAVIMVGVILVAVGTP